MTFYRIAVLTAIVWLWLHTNLMAADPLSPEQCRCVENRVQYDLNLNPAYLWGGASLAPGSEKDCSGALDAYFRTCGARTGQPRTTAARMGQGRDGWDYPLIPFEGARKLAIMTMTMPPARNKPVRVEGHVGILINDVSYGVTRMAHASSKWGFIASLVEQSDTNYYYPKIVRIRQTQGEQSN